MTGARTNASECVRRDGISFHSSHNEHTLTHTDRRGILCHKCRPRHPLPYKGRHCNKHLQFSRSHAILQDFSPSKSRNITTRNYPQPYRSINKQRYKKKSPYSHDDFVKKKSKLNIFSASCILICMEICMRAATGRQSSGQKGKKPAVLFEEKGCNQNVIM